MQAFLKERIVEAKLPAVIVHRKVTGKDVNMEAPGQLLKHYAPYLPCYVFSGDKPGLIFENKASNHSFRSDETAFISFDKPRYEPFRGCFKFYF